jgi:hypothetical protein
LHQIDDVTDGRYSYIKSAYSFLFYDLFRFRDIRDRSILRLFETDELKQPFNFQSALPISLSQLSFLDDGEALLDANDLDQPLDRCNPRLMISSPLSSGTWDEMSYFSEPEFESDYRPQHVHKAKVLVQRFVDSFQPFVSLVAYEPI